MGGKKDCELKGMIGVLVATSVGVAGIPQASVP
jgi:hypothetical protein